MNEILRLFTHVTSDFQFTFHEIFSEVIYSLAGVFSGVKGAGFTDV